MAATTDVLLSTETRFREGDIGELSAEQRPRTEVSGIDRLVTQASRLGVVERLLAIASEAVSRSGADQGSRFLLAEVAINLVSARETLYRADPADDLQVGLCAVATRDTLVEALVNVSKLALPEQWGEFVAIRDLAEAELREDPTGREDMEMVASSVIGGGRDLMSLIVGPQT